MGKESSLACCVWPFLPCPMDSADAVGKTQEIQYNSGGSVRAAKRTASSEVEIVQITYDIAICRSCPNSPYGLYYTPTAFLPVPGALSTDRGSADSDVPAHQLGTYFCNFMSEVTFDSRKQADSVNHELSNIDVKMTDTAVLDRQQRLTS